MHNGKSKLNLEVKQSNMKKLYKYKHKIDIYNKNKSKKQTTHSNKQAVKSIN